MLLPSYSAHSLGSSLSTPSSTRLSGALKEAILTGEIFEDEGIFLKNFVCNAKKVNTKISEEILSKI